MVKRKPEANQWNSKLETETACQLLDGDTGERNSILGFAKRFLCHLGKIFTNVFISMENTAFNLCIKDAYLKKREKTSDAHALLVSSIYSEST